jgi:hypothetical protein
MQWRYLFSPLLNQQVAKVDRILSKIEVRLMALGTMAQMIVDAVAIEKTQTASAIVLLHQLNDLIQSANNPEDLAALQQAASDLVADSQAVSDAIKENTPV